MSHFSVLVVTPTRPSKDELAKILQPWHEYECTGVDDEYVKDVPVDLEELRRDFEKYSSAGESFREWIPGWTSGRVEVDAAGEVTAVISRTNPNAQWDWWVVGGRWTGYLKLKPTAVFHSLGEPGTFQALGLQAGPEEGYADQAMLKDVDVDGMRAEAADKARDEWAFAQRVLGSLDRTTFKPWSAYVEEFEAHEQPNWQVAKEAYGSQPIAAAFRTAEVFKKLGFASPEDYFGEPADYLQVARDRALATFAVVKDGQWYQKGKVAWFGITHGEKEPDVWNKQFAGLIDGLDPTTWLTVVDCHI